MSGKRVRLRTPFGPWVSLAVGLVGAVLLATAFQPLDWWPMTLPGAALAILAVRGRSVRAAFGIGVATGGLFFLLHITWITVYLGWLPLVGLSLVMAIWWGLGGMMTALVWRRTESISGILGRYVAAPAMLAGVWMLRESLSGSWPWGGFAWGRLAYAHAGSPIGDTAAWVGTPGLSFLLAFVSALLATLAIARGSLARRRLTIGVTAVVALVAIPAFPVVASGSIRVGAVQGDSEAGLLAPYTRGEIIRQHAAASEALEGADLDVVVWPENAGEWNPQREPAHVALLDATQARLQAPLILGAVTNEGQRTYNSLLLWDAGVQGEYHKRHPVPFAEYVPSREVFAPLLDALGFLDLIPRDYSLDPTSANVFDVAGTTAGLAICFDIIDDGLVREMVGEREAEIIFAPTNNADFGEGSAENVQQLAIARLRAIEAGRALVNISTVGTSAMVLPDGSLVASLPQYEPGVMVETLPTSTTLTPAIAFGAQLETGIAVGTLGALLGLTLAQATRFARAPLRSRARSR